MGKILQFCLNTRDEPLLFLVVSLRVCGAERRRCGRSAESGSQKGKLVEKRGRKATSYPGYTW